MSDSHLEYIKKKKRIKILITFFQIIIFVFFIGFWQLSASLNWSNTFLTSSPLNVIKTLINLYETNQLFGHIFTTFYEIIISVVIGTSGGILVAIILWWYPFFAKVIDPYLTILNSLPKVALGPIFIIWIGANTKSIIFMALLISSIITIIDVLHGFNNTDKNKIKLLNSFNTTKFQILKYVILPENFKTIINAIKINVSMTLVGVIMGELLVSKKGIGYLITYGSQVFNINLVITGIFILVIISSLLYYLLIYFEKKLSVK